MYEIFEKLCKEHNVTPYKVSKNTGISRSTLSDWKNGKSVPKTDKLEAIAAFFGVSLEYLRTGKEVVSIVIDRGHEELNGTEYQISVFADPEKYTEEALKRWNEFEAKRWLPEKDRELIEKYHAADDGTQAAIRKLLDIVAEAKKEASVS